MKRIHSEPHDHGAGVVSVTVRGVGTWTYVTHIDPNVGAP